ncbi:hypothetical protein BC829DRAFT_171297 [Chytridium lagenaria]|nr:hypothetical protein BC829DRAFT_171297 [Chytridium lagenaria]
MDRSKRSAGSWKGRFTPSFNFTNRPRKTCFSLIIILSILTILKTFIVDPLLLQDYEVLSDDQSNLTSPNSSDPVPEPQNKTTYPPIPLLYLLQARKDYLDQVVSCDGSDTGDLILSKPTFLRCGKDSAARTYKQKVGNRIQNGPLRYESLKKAFDADKLQKERTRSEIRGALRKTPKMVESFDEDVIWINETREWERGWGAEKGEEREFRISKAFSGIGRGATLMECAVMDTTVPERFCLTKNVALRMSLLPKLPAQPMDHRKYSLPPSFGTLMGSCLLNETWWFMENYSGKEPRGGCMMA